MVHLWMVLFQYWQVKLLFYLQNTVLSRFLNIAGTLVKCFVWRNSCFFPFRPLFEGDNEFCLCLKESFPNLKTRKLTRVEWGTIRRLMGKPRRYFASCLSGVCYTQLSVLGSCSIALSLQVFVSFFCWRANSTETEETENAPAATKKAVWCVKLQRPSWRNPFASHHWN